MINNLKNKVKFVQFCFVHSFYFYIYNPLLCNNENLILKILHKHILNWNIKIIFELIEIYIL